jgi:polar amino acid transport system substrate-binding protein
MLRHRLLCALLLAPFGLCGAIAAPTAPSAPSLLLATHELPPYSTQTDGKPSGMAVRVVQCVAARMKVPLRITFLPWARAQVEAKSGQVDGFFAASRSAERDAYATLTDTIAPQEWRWYFLAKREGEIDPSSADFKQSAKVSSFRGANMQRWLEDNGYRAESPPVDSATLLRMLTRERLDAVLANHLVMEALLARQHPAPAVRSALAQDRPLGVYLTHRFTAQHPGFVARFNAELPACLVNKPPPAKPR